MYGSSATVRVSPLEERWLYYGRAAGSWSRDCRSKWQEMEKASQPVGSKGSHLQGLCWKESDSIWWENISWTWESLVSDVKFFTQETIKQPPFCLPRSESQNEKSNWQFRCQRVKNNVDCCGLWGPTGEAGNNKTQVNLWKSPDIGVPHQLAI